MMKDTILWDRKHAIAFKVACWVLIASLHTFRTSARNKSEKNQYYNCSETKIQFDYLQDCKHFMFHIIYYRRKRTLQH